MELTNSKRLTYSATYVTTQLRPEEQAKLEAAPGGGFAKAYQLRSLGLTPQDLDRLRTAMQLQKTRLTGEQEKLFAVAHRLAGAQRPLSTMELAAAIAPISYDTLARFVEAASAVKELSAASVVLVGLNDRRRKISPIGRIHLERIEMYPAGVEQGELVFTVPMAPGETVSISHKEWSTSSREFEEIVQDYFESYSERGVAEKSDASMSAENETKRSSAINFGASLSGTYAGVTLTTALGLSSTNDERESVKQSIQKTREVTEKASARTRKEHKVSVKLESKTGTEDQSAKTITNAATTPIRIDYYRMMRKWRTDLFRYGLRQTYDLAIPLPGVRLWALHQRLADMDAQLRAPLSFPLKPADIHSWNYRDQAIKWGATVQDPPAESLSEIRHGTIDWLDEGAADITRFSQLELDVPAGYFINAATATASLSIWPNRPWSLIIKGSVQGPLVRSPAEGDVIRADLASLMGKTGHLAVVYSHRYISMASIQVDLTYQLLKEAREKWQFDAWTQLRAAAEARHREAMARLQEERDRLWRLLNAKDTLSLRRLEREELMRLVIQWLLGPSYPLMPGGVAVDPANPPATEPVQTTVARLLANEEGFQAAATDSVSPTFAGVSEKAWFDAILFGDEFVKFMHQAIEWENLLYFMYPYFWGSEALGRDKLLFEHSDPEHERFLRAGYARVVLPIRPGFEEDFTNLIEHGTLGPHLASPYMPIAQDIAAFARTNYAGVPPANPELHARPLLFPEQRATWDAMQVVMKDLEAFKASTGDYPVTLDDLPSGMPLDAWGNPLVYRRPGLGGPYDLVSLGADNEVGGEGLDSDISSAAGASLVATWFDYTPTSALDIEVAPKPPEPA